MGVEMESGVGTCSLWRLLPHLQPGKGYAAVAKREGSGVREAWVKTVAFSTICVSLDKLFNLSLSFFICKAGMGAVPTSQIAVWIK